MNTQIGLTDVAADIDLFEIEPYIDGLTNYIRECKTPMTISIQGTWGTGKTSIMKMIEAKIKTQPDTYQCVTFNTWEFAQFNLEKNLSLVMLQSLIYALSEQDNFLSETIGNIVNVVARIGVGHIANGVDINNLAEVFQKGYLDQIKTLKREFQLLVNKKIGVVDKKFKLGKDKAENEEALNRQSGNKRIIFFIDDLDRLNPVKAVELLEVLKNFLDCKNCVFILAIDYDVVWRGVASKYGNMIGDNPDEIKKKGKDFFDKIIQVPFKMPVASYRVRKYIENCLKEIYVPVQNMETETYLELVENSIGTNPRSLKRIMNSLALLIKVIGEQRLGEMKGYKLLFASLCLQHTYEDVYNYLVTNSINKKLEFGHLDCLAEGDYDCFVRMFQELEITSEELEAMQPFMKVFVNQVKELNHGKSGNGEKNDEMFYLKEILNMSAITAGTSESLERKKVVDQVGQSSMRHVHFSDEQIKQIFSKVNGVLEGKEGYIVKYVNTKAYGHAEYRYKGKKFFDIVCYDDDRGWLEICCIPKDVSLWDEPELSKICETRGIMKGISYLSRKGISYKYRFNGESAEDMDLIILAKACVDNIFD